MGVKRTQRGLACAALCALTACAFGDEPPRYRAEAAVSHLLGERLAPGAFELIPPAPPSDDPADLDVEPSAALVALALDERRTFAWGSVSSAGGRLAAGVFVGPGAQREVQRLPDERVTDLSAGSRSAPFEDGALFIDCQDDDRALLMAPGRAPAVLALPTAEVQGCSATVLGRSRAPGRVAYASRRGAQLTIGALERRGDALLAVTAQQLPDLDLPDASVVLDAAVRIEELEEGRFEVLVFGPRRWEHVAADGRRLSAEQLRGPPMIAVRTADGDLLVAAQDSQDLLRWRVSGDAVLEPVAPLPDGGLGWYAPRGELTLLSLPDAPEGKRRLATLAEGSFTVVDLPRTPCASDARCDELGSSELLDVLQGSSPRLVYRFWGFHGPAGLWVAPAPR